MNDDPTLKKEDAIFALIPAHNEAANIERVVRQTAKHIPVWVVDDGSTDNTADLATKAGAHVLQQKPNQGKGVALRFGFQETLRTGCQGVITLDGDGQHDPDEIPNFLAELEKGPADMIIGTRQFNKMPFPRKYTNPVGKVLFNLTLGRNIQDNQSGYRFISRRLMQAALQSNHPGFEFEVEIITICCRSGFIIKEIPIKTIYYKEGKSHIRPWKHVVGFVKLLWQTATYRQEK